MTPPMKSAAKNLLLVGGIVFGFCTSQTRAFQPSFNGGKMQHIFKFGDRFQYVDEFYSPEAEQALLHGKMFYKVDGSNGMVHILKDDGTGNSKPKFKVYQRYDTRGKDPKEGMISLPSGPNPSVYGTRKVHTYYYQEVRTDPDIGKKVRKQNQAKLDVVERHLDKFIDLNREFISVEWVGTKFNRTPGVPLDVAVAIHEEQEVPAKEQINIERSFLGIHKYFFEDCAEQPVEGLIFAGKDGTYWKISTDGFAEGDKHPFVVNENRDKAKPPKFLK